MVDSYHMKRAGTYLECASLVLRAVAVHAQVNYQVPLAVKILAIEVRKGSRRTAGKSKEDNAHRDAHAA